MKKKALALVFLMCWFIGLAPQTEASLLDFEGLRHEDDLILDIGEVYQKDGFRLTNAATEESSGFAPSFGVLGTEAAGFSGSTALFNDNDDGPTVLTRINGGLFTLASISLSELLAAEPSVSIVFSGTLASGGTVYQTFILDGILGAEDFAFPAEFSNLVSVTWNQTADYHQFDNIKVSSVPIPATAWLLCSGLVGLAGVRSKMRKP